MAFWFTAPNAAIVLLQPLIRQASMTSSWAEDAGPGRVRGRVHGVAAGPGSGRSGAWITAAARRRAINRLRRNRSVADRGERLAELDGLDTQAEEPSMEDEGAIVDDRLRLIFTCCHPRWRSLRRVAPTLRALGGLSTGEIARAFLVPNRPWASR